MIEWIRLVHFHEPSTLIPSVRKRGNSSVTLQIGVTKGLFPLLPGGNTDEGSCKSPSVIRSMLYLTLSEFQLLRDKPGVTSNFRVTQGLPFLLPVGVRAWESCKSPSGIRFFPYLKLSELQHSRDYPGVTPKWERKKLYPFKNPSIWKV